MYVRRKHFLIGFGYALLGLITLAAAVRVSAMPPLVLWAVFAAAYALLSFYAVEVNDRLLMSSSVMPLLTGGIVFAAEGGSAVLGMTLMAALGPLSPRDIRERRVVQPAVNFGQLVVSSVLAGVAIDLVVGSPSWSDASPLLGLTLAGGLAALVNVGANIPLVRLGIRLIYGTPALQPWSGLRGLVVSEGVMGMLGGLLGGVLLQTSVSVVPLIAAVYVVGHMVFVSHARVRQAHESTLKAFIKSLETRDLYTRGHTERVVYFSRLIGEQLRLSSDRLARLRLAGIIHDVGKLAVPVELIRKQSTLTDDEYRELRRATHTVDDLLSAVDFLRPMVDIASGCHTRLTTEDFGQTGHVHTTAPSLEQQVLAVADTFDAITSMRGYRMALPQREAFAAMRADSHPLYDGAVIDALERGLRAVGETYGPLSLVASAAALVDDGRG